MVWLIKKYFKQDMQQIHKFNIHISILRSEESVKGTLRQINCKSFDANDKPRKGKTPTLSLLVSADPEQRGQPKGRGQPGRRPASLEKIESCAVAISNIYKTRALNFRHHLLDFFLHTLDF